METMAINRSKRKRQQTDGSLYNDAASGERTNTDISTHQPFKRNRHYKSSAVNRNSEMARDLTPESNETVSTSPQANAQKNVYIVQRFYHSGTEGEAHKQSIKGVFDHVDSANDFALNLFNTDPRNLNYQERAITDENSKWERYGYEIEAFENYEEDLSSDEESDETDKLPSQPIYERSDGGWRISWTDAHRSNSVLAVWVERQVRE
jgi:hypothetical protein